MKTLTKGSDVFAEPQRPSHSPGPRRALLLPRQFGAYPHGEF